MIIRFCAQSFMEDYTMKKIICFSLVLLLMFSATYPASADYNPFSDVNPTSWYCAAVTYSYYSGFSNVTSLEFRPNDAITRAEFILMLTSILLPDGIPAGVPKTSFKDIPNKSAYAKAVSWAVWKGFVTGTSETTFAPDAKIKRQDMALMIYKAEKLTEFPALPYICDPVTFQDEKLISKYAKKAVAALQKQGLLIGDKNGNVNPHGNLTRAEAVTVLSKIQLARQNHSHKYHKAELLPATSTEKACQIYRCSCGSFYGKYVNTAADPSYNPKRIYDGNKVISYSDALSVIDQLQERYPGLISSYDGGKSVWGTKIRVVKLGKGNRYIFMNGNLHAYETIGTNYLLKVLDEYAYAYATDGKIGSYRIKPLLDAWTIVMIPCSNPDGRARVLAGDTLKKTNGRGVNLNGNFPTNWHYASSGINGSKAGSEPETQTIISVLNQYPFELVLDCHTSGNVIYYADSDCSSTLISRSYTLAKAMKADSGFGLYYYSASAGLANYARHPYGVPGFTVEMMPYTEGAIDCTKFTSCVWSKLSTMPAIAMSFLK